MDTYGCLARIASCSSHHDLINSGCEVCEGRGAAGTCVGDDQGSLNAVHKGLECDGVARNRLAAIRDCDNEGARASLKVLGDGSARDNLNPGSHGECPL